MPIGGVSITSRCAECEAHWLPGDAERWQAHFSSDDLDETLEVCSTARTAFADDIPLVFIAFDVLSVEGRDVRRCPYQERRQILEELGLEAP